MKINSGRLTGAAATLVAFALLIAAAGTASTQRIAATQYGRLTQPNTSAAAGGSHSQSIVVRTSGVGFVEYGFADAFGLWPFGCSASSCTKAYNAPGGPGYPTGVYCANKTGTSVWSCRYP